MAQDDSPGPYKDTGQHGSQGGINGVGCPLPPPFGSNPTHRLALIAEGRCIILGIYVRNWPVLIQHACIAAAGLYARPDPACLNVCCRFVGRGW
eukprot:1150935-Pelagomonas_calceolata.AAC.12